MTPEATPLKVTGVFNPLSLPPPLSSSKNSNKGQPSNSRSWSAELKGHTKFYLITELKNVTGLFWLADYTYTHFRSPHWKKQLEMGIKHLKITHNVNKYQHMRAFPCTHTIKKTHTQTWAWLQTCKTYFSKNVSKLQHLVSSLRHPLNGRCPLLPVQWSQASSGQTLFTHTHGCLGWDKVTTSPQQNNSEVGLRLKDQKKKNPPNLWQIAQLQKNFQQSLYSFSSQRKNSKSKPIQFPWGHIPSLTTTYM